VATVKGRTGRQYVWHAEQLAPLVAHQFDHYQHTAFGLDLTDVFGERDAHATRAWAQHAANHYRIGIGSLRGRNRPLEVSDLVRIDEAAVFFRRCPTPSSADPEQVGQDRQGGNAIGDAGKEVGTFAQV
jgi:hypothetical protein